MPDPPGVLQGALTGGGVDNITGGFNPQPPGNSHPHKMSRTCVKDTVLQREIEQSADDLFMT